MAGKRFTVTMAAISIPLALAVHPVLAIDTQPEATPEPPARAESIDPGFIARIDGNVDPGFIVVWDDQSNDTGFIIGPGRLDPGLTPSPTPAPGTPAAIPFGAP